MTDSNKNLDSNDRLVINNISLSTIRKSKIHGDGLFSTSVIKKGTLLGVLDGQVMNWSYYNLLHRQLDDTLGDNSSDIFMEWNALDTETLLVRAFRTRYSYINHSREPNVEIIKYPLRLYAMTDLEINTEMTIDYRKEPLSDKYLKDIKNSYL